MRVVNNSGLCPPPTVVFPRRNVPGFAPTSATGPTMTSKLLLTGKLRCCIFLADTESPQQRRRPENGKNGEKTFDPDLTQPDPIQPDPIQPDPIQSDPSQIRSSQIRSSQIRSSQSRPSQIRSSQTRSSQTRSSQIRASQIRPSQIRSSRSHLAQGKPSVLCAGEVVSPRFVASCGNPAARRAPEIARTKEQNGNCVVPCSPSLWLLFSSK